MSGWWGIRSDLKRLLKKQGDRWSMQPKLRRDRLVHPHYRVLCRWVNWFIVGRNHNFSGRLKIQDVWMSTPFKVIAQPDDSKAVYTIAPSDGSCPPKNVHRTELRPCGQGMVGSFQQDVQSHSDVVSDGESDKAWVVRGEASTESLPGVGSRSEHELCSESDMDLGEQVDSEEFQSFDKVVQSPPTPLRQSSRQTAGKHPNPFNLPRSVMSNGGDGGFTEQIIFHKGHWVNNAPGKVFFFFSSFFSSFFMYRWLVKLIKRSSRW